MQRWQGSVCMEQLSADHVLRAGITEVQIIQWYVEEGAHIEEWKPLCQYQSDKAVDDVSSL